MSKILKAIDAVLLILFIICGAALLVPQFMGVSTVVVQQEMTGNAAVGTAIYAKRTEASSIEVGDRMLDLGTDSVGIYTVEAFDSATSTVTVSDAPQEKYNVSEYYLKVVLTVPFIGYLMLATQTRAGIAILAALLIYVIVSFIFAELMKRSDDEESDDEDEEDDEEDDFYAGLAARKKQRSAGKASAVENDDKREKTEARRTEKSEEDEERRPAKENRPSRRRRRHGDADEDEGIVELQDAERKNESREEGFGTDSLPDVQAALEAALVNQPLNRTGNISQSFALEPDDGEAVVSENGEIELAMPVRTADELLQKAYSEGLDPTVREDNITGVTLVDYSDSL